MKLYRTPGLTSEVSIDLTFNNLPHTLNTELQCTPLPRPRLATMWGTWRSDPGSTAQAVKAELTLEPRRQEQVEIRNLNLTCLNACYHKAKQKINFLLKI